MAHCEHIRVQRLDWLVLSIVRALLEETNIRQTTANEKLVPELLANRNFQHNKVHMGKSSNTGFLSVDLWLDRRD